MTNVSVHRFKLLLVAAFFLFSNFVIGQAIPAGTASLRYTKASAVVDSTYATSAGPSRPLNPVGMYRPDGSYVPILNAAQAMVMLVEQSSAPDQKAVPASFFAPSNEDAVENVVPPYRAKQRVQGQSTLASIRANFITLAYGHPSVLNTPTHVVTDSRGRLIVSDPELAAVHVLEQSGERSFRILGGPTRRLQAPGAVAVDRNDNIYVADGKLGLISVFDPDGKFLQYIGEVQGESMFDSPAAIAIDRKSGTLYVLDASANELIVFNLHGKVLKRVGAERSQTAVRLLHPSEIAIGRDEVVVLDHFGSRIQILDLDCQPKNSFRIRSENGPPVLTEVGLALDSHSQIYISNLLSSGVRVYSHAGEFLGFLGRSGVGQKFNQPLGIWVDAVDRLFISDSNNSRVQVFQLANGESAVPAARN